MKKRRLSLILTLVMLMSLTVPTLAEELKVTITTGRELAFAKAGGARGGDDARDREILVCHWRK